MMCCWNPCSRWERLTLMIAAIVGLAAPSLFTIYTNNTWEDYFITVRHSENLARGDGLVYNVGERVHGFTSPIGVLLPAALHWLLQADHYAPTLAAFRVVCILVISLMLTLAVRLLQLQRVPLPMQWLFVGAMGCDIKTLAFCTNGMETSFMLLFVVWTLHELRRGVERSWLRLGLAWGALMWTRPDSCVYIALFGGGTLLLGEGRWPDRFKGLLKAAAVCTVVYLPWFVSAWAYYGSPVPQTIIAKSLGSERSGEFTPSRFNAVRAIQELPETLTLTAMTVYLPAYGNSSNVPKWMTLSSVILATLAAFQSLLPSVKPLTRTLSFTFAGLMIYLNSMWMIYPWYCPPVAMLGFLVMMMAAAEWLERWNTNLRWLPTLLGLLGFLAVGGSGLVTIEYSRLMKTQQELIEDQHRQQIGLYLKQAMKPGETVYLEPIGYIGYFSNQHISDYPGLVNRRVTQLRREHQVNFDRLVPHLRPDWIVVRPYEHELLLNIPEVARDYTLVKSFSVLEQVKQHSDLVGHGILEFDAEFRVLRRKKASD